MAIYIFLFILIGGFSFIELFAARKTTRVLYWTLVILLIFFVGLRGYEVGFDYISYMDSFKELGQGDGAMILMEPGYVLLNKVIYLIGPFTLLLFIMAMGSIAIKSIFIDTYSRYPLTSLLLYFSIALLINDMGQIRYGMAISFMMLSFGAMIQQKRWQVWLFWGFAMMFHYSSLLGLPILFFYNYRTSARNVAVLLFFSICFYWVNINTVLQVISVFLPAFFSSKIHLYTFYSETYGQSLGLNISLFLRLLILGILFYYKETLTKHYPGTNIIFNLYLYGVLIYMILNSNAEFATRGSAYFKVLDLVILPMFIGLGRTRLDKTLIWATVVAYAFYSLSKILFDVEFGEPYLNYTNVLFT